ncbi:otolith matrix protein OMM-64 [Heracleum sosnowskyi]|uniref:Otolith matrix protein OMM-64 n=1 Tax=Heracleum sosnowskyi TaxID=360622 RepID=A0AAD8IUG3_9APIA|nr:otolith matrix protein OMM-64 [Heracleum sosnowskyi]
MESDDDYQSFSPPSNSPSHFPKFKRLKKKSSKSKPIRNEPEFLSSVDFKKLEALEGSRSGDLDDSEPIRNEPVSRNDGPVLLTSVDFAEIEALEGSRSGEVDVAKSIRDELVDDGVNLFMDVDFARLEALKGSRSGEVDELVSCVDFKKLEDLEGSKSVSFDDSEDLVMSRDEKDSEDLGEKIADLKTEVTRKKRSARGGLRDKKRKIESVLSLPRVDFEKLEALKNVGSDDSSRESFGDGEERGNVDGGVRKVTKRVLDFDDENCGGAEKGDGEGEKVKVKVSKSEKKRISEGEGSEKIEKKKKKRVKGSSEETKLKEKPSNKRREEKERKAYLEQLHAESQRLLRETSGAGFKPVPVVQKPISSLLEKIRQRKLEVSKKMSLLNNSGYSTENNDSLIEPMTGTDSRKVSTRGGGEDNLSDKVEVDTKTDASLEDIKSSLDASITDGVKGLRTHSSPESEKSPMAVSEEPTPTFRAPVDDTQDLFDNSETIDDKDDKLDNQHSSPMEEVLAPSLLTMNLKIDSVPLDDDISSDEDDNDKENLKPITFKPSDPCPSPKGDPVKAFVDDEAEEEDDSDHDIRFNENDEDDGNEDSDELNDLIVTGYEEKSIDNERRNELHQKWLEQQDAAGTDNLMQRLGCGPKVKENTLFDVEIESDEDDEGSSDDEEDVGPAKAARINARKAKQMIPQMFADKEDPFVSSDDEETEKMLVKQRLLEKVEDKATLIPPAEDENSREIFGLIKKLNNAPIAKKKQKVPSFFETLITGGSSSSSSSKSSFLGRVSSHSLPSKQRSSTTRSFIFGRDDSNSRSSISISEDSSDAVAKEIRPTQKATAKFTSSQAKSFTQSSQIVAETTPGTSLIEILKRSSMQSTTCNQDNMVGMTQTIISAFKIPKKPVKLEGRTKY